MADQAPVTPVANADRSHLQAGPAGGARGKLNPQQIFEKAAESVVAVASLPAKELFRAKFIEEQGLKMLSQTGNNVLDAVSKTAGKALPNPVSLLLKLIKR